VRHILGPLASSGQRGFAPLPQLSRSCSSPPWIGHARPDLAMEGVACFGVLLHFRTVPTVVALELATAPRWSAGGGR
jgi:hypothetical protein